TVKEIEKAQRLRATAIGSPLDVFAAAEGMTLEIIGKGSEKTVGEYSALDRRPIVGGRVMIVSPHHPDFVAIEQVLPDDGLSLTPVPEGRTALEVAARISPDLVIINAKLADGDGASFIQPLRTLLNKPDLPVLLLTEGRDGTETLYSAESIATDYLAKPFSPPMLRTRVRAWLARTIGTVGTPLEVILPPPDQDIDPVTLQEDCPQVGSMEEVLASIPIFASLSPDQLERLVASSTEHSFPPGYVLVCQDDPGEDTYVIVSGRARVTETVSDSPVQMFL